MSQDCLNTQILKHAINISEDESAPGFDLQAGKSWIYPTNYPIRDYQFNISQAALFQNTLVSLPTGLGKTFIAAVIMYNFYRWYPNGKVIFMAPTRPLVKQQIDACYNIMAIPAEATAELTGNKLQASRADIWAAKRVFFVTPQVLQNDLHAIPHLAAKIRCLVFDEAHRAKGGYAYCEVIRALAPHNSLFRVLALSATPGNTVKDVLEVIQNLLISRLEFRTEESDDVKAYVFSRALETVVVPLGDKLQQIKEAYIMVLDRYTRVLIRYSVIQGDCANISKGKIVMVMKGFQERHRTHRTENYAEIMKNLTICVTLYHGYELLVRHGLRSFLNFFDDHINQPLMRGNVEVLQIMDDIRAYLGPMPNVDVLPDGSYPQVPAMTKFGHPKFYQLRDILMDHFTTSAPDSRVIVFFEYRHSATEAFALLIQARPLIKARIFLGQGDGITQKLQLSVVNAFRAGACNTLLSTCIGEEGLDVGEVNLIVCFDVSNKSPIRMIQRMGRTGRKKAGKVIIMVTEGKEQQTLKDCLVFKSNLSTLVLNSPQLLTGMYAGNPRLVPEGVEPKCERICITVKKAAGKNGSLMDFCRRGQCDFGEDLEGLEVEERLPKVGVMRCFGEEKREIGTEIDFGKHLEMQRILQPFSCVKHSRDSKVFVELLQFADSKRFNIPVGQSQANKNLKQGDIRSMFANNNIPKASIASQMVLSQPGKEDSSKIFPPNLMAEITTFLTIHKSERKNNFFDVLKYRKIVAMEDEKIDWYAWVQPDFAIVEGLSGNDFDLFTKSLQPYGNELIEFEQNKEFDDIDFDLIEHEIQSLEDSKEVIEAREIKEQSFAFEAPKSFVAITKADPVEEIIKSENIEVSNQVIDDAASILAFFLLNKLEDIFESNEVDLDATIIYSQEMATILEKSVDNDREMSPDLFSESPDLFSPEKRPLSSPKVESPVLCTFERLQSLKTRKRFFEKGETSFNERIQVKKPNLSKLRAFRGEKKDEIDLDISDFCELSLLNAKNVEENVKNDSLHDFFDVDDLFVNKSTKETKEIVPKSPKLADIDDILNITDFLRVSPEPAPKPSQAKKTAMSIKEILSYVAKPTQTGPETSQKENKTPERSENTLNYHTSSEQKQRNILKLKKVTPKSSTPIANRKPKRINIPLAANSEDEFETTSSPILSRPKASLLRLKPRRERAFLDEEAVLSDDVADSGDETSDGLDDEYEKSFVEDEEVAPCTQMHAQYLQSIRSPLCNGGRFKIPSRPRKNVSYIFSQEVPEEDSYANDSFCIDTEQMLNETKNAHDLSELEILEQKLKEQRRKKRKKNSEKEDLAAKRRRIIVISSDSDD